MCFYGDYVTYSFATMANLRSCYLFLEVQIHRVFHNSALFSFDNNMHFTIHPFLPSSTSKKSTIRVQTYVLALLFATSTSATTPAP